MILRVLEVEGFRNLVLQSIPVSPGLTLVVGANGAGKTSLLEAVAVLGNLASFRASTLAAAVRHGAAGCRLGGEIERDGSPVEIRQELRLGARMARLLFRGARRLGAAEYLDLMPVVPLSAGDREFLHGPPEQRRRFLDRTAFFRATEALSVLQRYRRVLRQRNAALAAAASDREIDAFDAEFSRLGARVIQLRLEALAALEPLLAEELSALSWSLSLPALRYDCPDRLSPADPATTAQRLRAGLLRARRRERQRGHTLVGPHRHDLAVTVRGVEAKESLSAGQAKLLVTALKLAATRLMERVRGQRPITVFDDVDTEFDAAILGSVMARLADGRQALLSTPHEERLHGCAVPLTRWRVVDGRVAAG